MKLNSSLKEENTVLITPLIDIMFLILIFFVLNTSFTSNKAVEINVPQAVSGESSKVSEFYIFLTHDHKIFINEKEVDIKSFSSELLSFIGSNSNPDIILEGDRSISYEFLMGIMDRVRVLGFENISLIVTNK